MITDANEYKIKNEALNYETSSISSDLNLKAMLTIWPREEALSTNLFWPIHDSILGQIREDRLEGLQEIATIMANTPKNLLGGVFSEVKYKVEMKIGPNWGRMQKAFTVESG